MPKNTKRNDDSRHDFSWSSLAHHKEHFTQCYPCAHTYLFSIRTRGDSETSLYLSRPMKKSKQLFYKLIGNNSKSPSSSSSPTGGGCCSECNTVDYNNNSTNGYHSGGGDPTTALLLKPSKKKKKSAVYGYFKSTGGCTTGSHIAQPFFTFYFGTKQLIGHPIKKIRSYCGRFKRYIPRTYTKFTGSQ